jgi:protein-tyrosine phosphatase
MAAAIGEKMLAEAQIPAMVLSAGTLGILGNPAAPHAVTAMAEAGIDISRHRSQGLSLQLAKLADELIVLAPIHEREILAREPSLEPKIQRLWEYAEPLGRLSEIADPVGLELPAFVSCRIELEACIGKWVERKKRFR